MLGIEIFIPVLLHMLLVVMLYVVLALRKAKAVKAGLVNRKSTALDNKAWNDDVVKVSNNIDNQFETPIMFYLLTAMIFLTGIVDVFSLALCWSWVVIRYIHAWVHIGRNYVPNRLKLFALSLLIILVLLLRVLLTIIASIDY